MSQNMDFDDFVQIGNEGIVSALDTMKPSDHAGTIPNWIKIHVRGACMSALSAQNGAFSLPSSRKEKLIQRSFARDSNALTDAGYSWSEIRETLAEKYRVHPLDIDALREMRRGGMSVAPDGWEESDRGNFVCLSSTLPDAEEEFLRAQSAHVLGRLLADAGLTERERECLLARFKDGETVSYDTLSAEYGVSRERIRQYVKKGLEKMRALASERGLALQDFL